MAAAGWKVAILDLDEPSAKEAADEVAERHQAQTVGLRCDVTDEGSVEAALAALDGSMPPIGALINTPASRRQPDSSTSPARSGIGSLL
jgi:NAD(P)-dependent dehydrogenase (short-subunit alcohol dehydrogenase family)